MNRHIETYDMYGRKIGERIENVYRLSVGGFIGQRQEMLSSHVYSPADSYLYSMVRNAINQRIDAGVPS